MKRERIFVFFPSLRFNIQVFIISEYLNQATPYYKFALALHPIQILYQNNERSIPYDMSSSYQPSHATHQPQQHHQPQQRHQPQQTSRRRYIAHRVQESLTSRFAKCCCSLFLSLLLIVAVIMFILWLNLRPHRPRFYLQSFSAPGLAQSTSPAVNSAFTFNVTDRNSNHKIGMKIHQKHPFFYTELLCYY